MTWAPAKKAERSFSAGFSSTSHHWPVRLRTSRLEAPMAKNLPRQAHLLLGLGLAGVLACASSSTPVYGPRSTGFGYAEPLPRLASHEQDAITALGPMLARKGLPNANVDGRLMRAAQALNWQRSNDRTREACDSGDGAVEQALSWAGVFERPVCSRCLWTRKKTPEVPEEILASLADCMAGPGEPLLGVATLADGDRTFVTVLGTRRQVLVDPVARNVPRDTPWVVTGIGPKDGRALLAVVALPNTPVVVVPLALGETGGFELQAPAAHGPGAVRVSLLLADEEVARLHMDGGGPATVTAFPQGREAPQDPMVALAALRRSLDQLRQRSGNQPLKPSGSLDAVAQEEVNHAPGNAGWTRNVTAEARTRQLGEAVGSWRIFRRTGPTATDVTRQVEMDPLLLWSLTRPTDTFVGVGWATLSKDVAHPMGAAVIILGVGQPNGLDPVTP